MTGAVHPYGSAIYASAFAPLRSIHLRNVRTHVLVRPIAGAAECDAMGCYPLCVFDANDGIREDFAELARVGIVSLVIVTDCLTQPDHAFLDAHFDRVRPYKAHYVYDARLPNGDYTKHHRDRARRARKSCETRVVALSEHLDSWCACYETLVKKKGITGIQNFSRSYFETISEMPEAVTIAAFAGGEFVSGHIWFRFGRHAHAHLAASTELGYKLRSAFAIYDHAIQLFRNEYTIDFGGGAGAEASQSDGLADFKRGFANAARENFLCGKILDGAAYERLSTGPQRTDGYFPAYRRP